METTCACEEREAVTRIVERYRGREGILVDVLHDIQSDLGYLPDAALRRMSDELGIPVARAYGVASFYSGFRFTPPPENEVKVCTGTACHVRGASAVLERFEESLGIKAGEATEDGWVGLETVSCVGCCALAPALVVNGKVRRGVSPEKVIQQLPPARGKDESVT